MSDRKRHDKDTTGSVAQDTGRLYGSHLLVLGNGPIDIVNPKNAGLSTAIDIQTAVHKVNEGGMPNIPCVVTEFAEILLQLVKMRD